MEQEESDVVDARLVVIPTGARRAVVMTVTVLVAPIPLVVAGVLTEVVRLATAVVLLVVLRFDESTTASIALLSVARGLLVVLCFDESTTASIALLFGVGFCIGFAIFGFLFSDAFVALVGGVIVAVGCISSRSIMKSINCS